MKKTLLILGCCAAIASAEVAVKDTTDPIDGHRNVILGIEGDAVFSSATKKPTLALACEVWRGKGHKPRILLDARAIVVGHATGTRGAHAPFRVEYRFEGDPKPRIGSWVESTRPGLLWNPDVWPYDRGFFQKMLSSKRVYIKVETFQAGAATVGFDLTGFAEAFAKQEACKQ
jgi:hypothetical protein